MSREAGAKRQTAGLSLPGNSNALAEVSRFVMRVAGRARLDLPGAYRLRLAVDEIATNIVLYGYQRAGLSGSLLLRAEWDRELLTLHLEDSGVTFDPRCMEAPPHLHLPAEKREIGGLGIHLALGNVDSFDYRHTGNRNRSSFVIRIRATELGREDRERDTGASGS